MNAATLSKFSKGQILILFSFMLIVLIGMVGLAIDSGRAYGVKAKLNAAVDAASIAAARALSEGATDADRITNAQTAANKFFLANFPNSFLGASPGSPQVLAIHDSTGYWRVTVSGSANMPNTFMKIFGNDDIQVTAMGQTIRRDLDMIFVLDTSGSLDSPPSPSGTFDTLKQQSIKFLNNFSAGNGGDRVGLVTFASGAVLNVPINKNSTRGFNRTTINNAINNLSVSGSTASAEAMRIALNELNQVPSAVQSSLRVIVFFSDGAPNDVSGTFDYRTGGGGGGGSLRQVTGDLYSETSSGGAPDRVWNNTRRDTYLGDYSNITTLPQTGVGGVALASYNNKRTLSGTPFSNTRCNVNKAARNMLENIANTARSQSVVILSLGLGSALNSNEVTFCGYSTDEYGANILKRLANISNSDTYNAAQPIGVYAYAATATELERAFTAIASEILRLAM